MKSLSLRAAQRGFTLIEIMVVVVILGVLAAIVVPKVLTAPGEARITRAKNDIQAISSSLARYKLDNFFYPTTQQGIQALVSKPDGDPPAKNWKPYLDKMPKDPWGNDYQYLQPGTKGEFDLFSLGADNRPGGEGESADVGNWDSAG